MTTRHDPFGLLAFIHWDHDWNNHHFEPATLKKSIEQLHDLGISFLRMDILWSDVHAGIGKYNFDRYDRIIEALERKNINVLALFNYNRDYLRDGKEIWNTPPMSHDEFAAYACAAVSRYKHWIKHWEVWNEPNHSVYWAAPKDNLKLYSALLKTTSTAIKKTDPGCTVLNGGLTATILDDVENLYQHAGKDAFDVLNIHPFINPKRADAEAAFDSLIRSLEMIMDKHGDSKKKIWITEMGCPGVPKNQTKSTWFEGEAQNEDEQAAWLERVYDLIKKHPRVEKLFWAFYRDTDAMFKDATDYLGIVRKDLSPKPSFFSMKKLISRHAGHG
jgi:hypothetical protein